jgi:hypothetical protein
MRGGLYGLFQLRCAWSEVVVHKARMKHIPTFPAPMRLRSTADLTLSGQCRHARSHPRNLAEQQTLANRMTKIPASWRRYVHCASLDDSEQKPSPVVHDSTTLPRAPSGVWGKSPGQPSYVIFWGMFLQPQYMSPGDPLSLKCTPLQRTRFVIISLQYGHHRRSQYRP